VWSFRYRASAGGNKAKLVRKALGIRQFDHHWTLPNHVAGSTMFWPIEVDGFVADARQLPAAVQEAAVRKGLIPFVHQPSDPKAIE
jgi:hypothetical protein